MDPIIRRLLTPGPAEIIRASQKDTEYVKLLQNDFEDVAQIILGQRLWQKYREHFKYLPTLLYHSLTNLSGLQTLGEEYTGLVQVDKTGGILPGKTKLSLMILLTTFGHTTVPYVIKLLEKHVSNQNQPNLSRNNQLPVLLDKLCLLQDYLPFFGQIHLAIFYVHGTFYHFAKRLLGIHYLLVRRSFANEDPESRRTLKYLMWMSVLNSVMTAFLDSYAFINRKRRDIEQLKNEDLTWSLQSDPSDVLMEHTKHDTTLTLVSEVESSQKCSLCLEPRTNSSVTPCGHLFCWNCILDWLRTKQECPVCREQCAPSRVVPLQNYN